MEDRELQAIRERRMAELQGNRQGSNNNTIPSLSGMQGGGSKEDEEKRSQMEAMRQSMLDQILDNEARERLARIRIVKPDKADSIENSLIHLVQSGQIRSKMSDQQLKSLIDQFNKQEPSSASKTSVVFNRKRFDEDSEEEEYDL